MTRRPSIRKKLNKGERITFGKSRISFDMSDFEDADHRSELRGISGLGYYIKHGLIESDFGGVENALIQIDNNPALTVETDAKASEIEVICEATLVN